MTGTVAATKVNMVGEPSPAAAKSNWTRENDTNMSVINPFCEANLLAKLNYLKNRICNSHGKSDPLAWLHCTAVIFKVVLTGKCMGSISNVCHGYGERELQYVCQRL